MNNIYKTALFCVAIIITFFLGAGWGGAGHPFSDSSASLQTPLGANMEPVWEAWNILNEKFVPATTTNIISTDDHVWGIIEGLANSYNDPYTVFFPPESSKQFEEEISGSFGGVGIEIGMRDDMLTIIAPLKGTPADHAGLFSGDIIVEINGTSTQRMDIDHAIHLLRGEVGTEVVLTIAREGEQEFLTIPIIRDTIEIPTLETTLRDDGIFVVSLYNFGGTATNEFKKALREFLESTSTKLIIDLRGNPGGYLEAAVEVASFFLPISDVIVTEDYGSRRDPIVHRSKGYNVIDNQQISIVILVDGGTASASEIVAAALREHDKALLIGEHTFGKGSVQELVPVTTDTSLKVTVARWMTPSGNSISEIGLTPDFEVELTTDDYNAGIDTQLDAAVAYLLTGTTPVQTPRGDEETKSVDE